MLLQLDRALDIEVLKLAWILDIVFLGYWISRDRARSPFCNFVATCFMQPQCSLQIFTRMREDYSVFRFVSLTMTHFQQTMRVLFYRRNGWTAFPFGVARWKVCPKGYRWVYFLNRTTSASSMTMYVTSAHFLSVHLTEIALLDSYHFQPLIILEAFDSDAINTIL